jgi:hypothetical protein
MKCPYFTECPHFAELPFRVFTISTQAGHLLGPSQNRPVPHRSVQSPLVAGWRHTLWCSSCLVFATRSHACRTECDEYLQGRSERWHKKINIMLFHTLYRGLDSCFTTVIKNVHWPDQKTTWTLGEEWDSERAKSLRQPHKWVLIWTCLT